jgi:hypothetical protein
MLAQPGPFSEPLTILNIRSAKTNNFRVQDPLECSQFTVKTPLFIFCTYVQRIISEKSNL